MQIKNCMKNDIVVLEKSDAKKAPASLLPKGDTGDDDHPCPQLLHLPPLAIAGNLLLGKPARSRWQRDPLFARPGSSLVSSENLVAVSGGRHVSSCGVVVAAPGPGRAGYC